MAVLEAAHKYSHTYILDMLVLPVHGYGPRCSELVPGKPHQQCGKSTLQSHTRRSRSALLRLTVTRAGTGVCRRLSPRPLVCLAQTPPSIMSPQDGSPEIPRSCLALGAPRRPRSTSNPAITSVTKHWLANTASKPI